MYKKITPIYRAVKSKIIIFIKRQGRCEITFNPDLLVDPDAIALNVKIRKVIFRVINLYNENNQDPEKNERIIKRYLFFNKKDRESSADRRYKYHLSDIKYTKRPPSLRVFYKINYRERYAAY